MGDGRNRSDSDALVGKQPQDKKSAGKVELDWSRPYTSINLANIKSIEMKKDNKLEIVQFKPQKSKVNSKRYSVVSNMTKEASSALNEITSQSTVKFQEKMTLKGTDDNTYHEWHDYLSKTSAELKEKLDSFQVIQM